MYKKLRQYIASIINNIGIVYKENKIILLFSSSIIIVVVIITSINIPLLVLDTYAVVTMILLIFQLIAVYRKNRYIAFLHLLLLPIIFILFVLIIKTLLNTNCISNKIISSFIYWNYHINIIPVIIFFILLVIVNCIFICFVTRRSIINTLLRKKDVLPLRLATVDSHLSDGIINIDQAKQERKNIIADYNQNCLIDGLSKFLKLLFIMSSVVMIIVIIYYCVVCNTKSTESLIYSIYLGLMMQLILLLYSLSIFLWNKFLY